MKRGFKAHAERIATKLRKELGLEPHHSLPALKLAEHLGLVVIAPNNIPNIPVEILEEVMRSNNGWSALTIANAQPPLLIYNPTHSERRQESNLMHEIAHLLEKHEPSSISFNEGMPFREYDSEQEAEAAWLGGCLQIPREGLIWAVRQRLNDDEIAAHFNASKEMVRFRRNATGVERQLARMKR